MSGRLSDAVHLYERHLARSPNEFDALHMRAVALLQSGCIEEARGAFRELWGRHPEPPAPAWTNLGLLAAAACHLTPDSRARAAIADHEQWQARVREALAKQPTAAAPDPTIGVAVASYNHVAYVKEALGSIRAQARLPNQIVVIDDGSTDGSVAVIERALADFPSTVALELVVRGNRGAARTLNEAIGKLATSWVAPLNSDDRFDSDRLMRLASAASQLQPLDVEFLIGGIDLIGPHGATLAPPLGPRARSALLAHTSVQMHHSIGLSLLAANCTVTSGNQFFTKSLWERLNGYRDFKYNHDWDFALRACRLTEPVLISGARYSYRVHDTNTIATAGAAAVTESRALLANFIRERASGNVNPHAPTFERWGSAFWEVAGCVDALAGMPVEALFSDREAAGPGTAAAACTAPDPLNTQPEIAAR